MDRQRSKLTLGSLDLIGQKYDSDPASVQSPPDLKSSTDGLPTFPGSPEQAKQSRPHCPSSEVDQDPLTDPIGDLTRRLDEVFRDAALYRRLLGCDAAHVQRLLDSFQWLLDKSESEPGPSFRRNLVVAVQRLSNKTGLYPVCFELEGVTQDGEEPIGAGGFADIYKGSFKGSFGERPVCMKVIRLYQESEVTHLLKHFSKEAILWSQLLHPNVLPIYGLFRFRHNRLCIISPFMEYGDITKYLKRNSTAPRVQLTHDVAQGLSYLHDNGIIHGDLKGPNILVDNSGRARVADFGISSVSDPDILAWTSHSSASSKGGSTRWQAPELFDMVNDEMAKNTVSSDVYAWGCVCYEIFTGNIPFVNIPFDPTVIFQVKSGVRPARPAESSPSWDKWGLTENIWNLILLCWNESPSSRPSIRAAIQKLTPELGKDVRRIGSSDLSSLAFRQLIDNPTDIITVQALNDLLRDTSLDLESLTYHTNNGVIDAKPSPVGASESAPGNKTDEGHKTLFHAPASGLQKFRTAEGHEILFYVRALYDYTATIEEEFDFQSGDIIAVTATPDDGWWSGELADKHRRQKGRHIFPSNFVHLL